MSSSTPSSARLKPTGAIVDGVHGSASSGCDAVADVAGRQRVLPPSDVGGDDGESGGQRQARERRRDQCRNLQRLSRVTPASWRAAARGSASRPANRSWAASARKKSPPRTRSATGSSLVTASEERRLLVEATVRRDLELASLEETLEDRAGIARRSQPDHAKRDVAASDRVDGLHERRDVVGCGLQVADEEDRGVLDLVALENRPGELERRRDARPGAEGPGPRIHGVAEPRRHEQPQHGRRCDAGVPGGSSS